MIALDLEQLVEAIADRVVTKLRATPSCPAYFTAKSPPPGWTARRFSDAIRRGELRAAKVGRSFVASAEDVRAFIESHAVTKPTNATNDAHHVRALADLRARAGGSR